MDAEKAPAETLGGSSHHDGDHPLGMKPANEDIVARNEKKEKDAAATGKRELKQEDCEAELGYAFPSWKKWWILTVIFLVQTSMNFNTSLYSNGLSGISEKFGVSEQAARVGAAIFLVFYAFGCELWAPWSEEFGRKPVLQASLFLVNIWTLPVVLAPNFGSLLVGRALGGLSSAGGSVTLGMIADLFDSDNQQYAVAYIVFSSVGGSILGPIIGGFVQQYLAWQWTIWIQLIFGGFVQILHLFTVPETRTTVMIDRIAKKRRKSGADPNIYGPNELEPFRERFTFKELMHTWARPFRMFLTEPIVLSLSLLSGFSDALIFMQIQSFSLVYTQWGFNDYQTGLAFIPIGIGYVIAWISFIPAIKRNKKARERNPHDEHAQYEARLDWLLYTAPCLPIGLIIFAWTTSGPPLHWIGSMVGSAIIGIANYAIYFATVDFMLASYGEFSSSATGGNGWARDFLAGVLTVPATPFYTNIGASQGKNLQYASTILFCISLVLVLFVYIIYWKGPVLRKRSPFAQTLAAGGKTGPHNGSRRDSMARQISQRKETEGSASQQDSPFAGSHTAINRDHSSRANSYNGQAVSRPATIGDRFGPGSRRSSYYSSRNAASRNASRRNSFEEDVQPSASVQQGN
ncbi:putative MFS multidrug transporter [Xylariales sp. PMI_506]|nr:putative MFS multidrug transporter [Xylariales sp. PMI_506]